MTEPAPRLERLLEAAARRLAGSPLHPIELIASVEAAFLAASRDGLAPNVVRVLLHPADYRRYRTAVPALQVEVEAALDRLERREGLTPLGRRLVSIAPGAAPESSPVATATFADTEHQRPEHAAEGASHTTLSLVRHRGVRLRAGEQSVALTHTPFTIGRAAGNDLVVASLAVSRFHARITWSRDDGFAIEDLGSRNGLVTAAQRVTRARLPAPEPVIAGDIPLELELPP